MSDTTKILRRLDEEIIYCNQQIAALQVRIVTAQNSRRFIMGLEEDDQAAQAMRREANAALNGRAFDKPMLIVRKANSGDDPNFRGDIYEAQPPPLGIVASGKRKGLPRVRQPRAGTKTYPKKAKELRERVLNVVTPGEEPMSPKEIGNNIGLSVKEEDRKPLWNVLYNMKAKGLIQRNEKGDYFRPAEGA